MKTSFGSTLGAILVALTVSVSSAGIDPQPDKSRPQMKAFDVAMYPAAGSSKVWLTLEKVRPEFKVNVELLDQKGNVLFHEILPGRGARRNNGFIQSFDLSAVQDGNYTFRISTTGFQTEEFNFGLSTPEVTERPARQISMN